MSLKFQKISYTRIHLSFLFFLQLRRKEPKNDQLIVFNHGFPIYFFLSSGFGPIPVGSKPSPTLTASTSSPAPTPAPHPAPAPAPAPQDPPRPGPSQAAGGASAAATARPQPIQRQNSTRNMGWESLNYTGLSVCLKASFMIVDASVRQDCFMLYWIPVMLMMIFAVLWERLFVACVYVFLTPDGFKINSVFR